jgi:hypothetical protein
MRRHLRFDSIPVPFVSRVIRASLYGASVFVSFFLMLVFMTYNVSVSGMVFAVL